MTRLTSRRCRHYCRRHRRNTMAATCRRRPFARCRWSPVASGDSSPAPASLAPTVPIPGPGTPSTPAVRPGPCPRSPAATWLPSAWCASPASPSRWTSAPSRTRPTRGRRRRPPRDDARAAAVTATATAAAAAIPEGAARPRPPPPRPHPCRRRLLRAHTRAPRRPARMGPASPRNPLDGCCTGCNCRARRSPSDSRFAPATPRSRMHVLASRARRRPRFAARDQAHALCMADRLPGGGGDAAQLALPLSLLIDCDELATAQPAPAAPLPPASRSAVQTRPSSGPLAGGSGGRGGGGGGSPPPPPPPSTIVLMFADPGDAPAPTAPVRSWCSRVASPWRLVLKLAPAVRGGPCSRSRACVRGLVAALTVVPACLPACANARLHPCVPEWHALPASPACLHACMPVCLRMPA